MKFETRYIYSIGMMILGILVILKTFIMTGTPDTSNIYMGIEEIPIVGFSWFGFVIGLGLFVFAYIIYRYDESGGEE